MAGEDVDDGGDDEDENEDEIDGDEVTGDADGSLITDGDRPAVLGQSFDGPMPGHSPVMPVHYDLHVWVYEANESGTFAQFNPSVSC